MKSNHVPYFDFISSIVKVLTESYSTVNLSYFQLILKTASLSDPLMFIEDTRTVILIYLFHDFSWKFFSCSSTLSCFSKEASRLAGCVTVKIRYNNALMARKQCCFRENLITGCRAFCRFTEFNFRGLRTLCFQSQKLQPFQNTKIQIH